MKFICWYRNGSLLMLWREVIQLLPFILQGLWTATSEWGVFSIIWISGPRNEFVRRLRKIASSSFSDPAYHFSTMYCLPYWVGPGFALEDCFTAWVAFSIPSSALSKLCGITNFPWKWYLTLHLPNLAILWILSSLVTKSLCSSSSIGSKLSQ